MSRWALTAAASLSESWKEDDGSKNWGRCRQTRSGKPCRAPAMKNRHTGRRVRCRMHGGASSGPKTAEGLERCHRSNWRHGQRSQEAIERHRRFMSFIRQTRLHLQWLDRQARAYLREQRRAARRRGAAPKSSSGFPIVGWQLFQAS
jgi:hypothetical protein